MKPPSGKICLLFLCGALFLATLCFWSSLKQKALDTIALLSPPVRQIHIKGGDKLDKRRLLEEIGLRLGAPLLLVDGEALTEKLTRFPLIQDVAITRRLSGDVHIDLTLRQAVAMVAFEELSLIDSHGVIFRTLQPKESIDLPVITGVVAKQAEINNETRQLLASALDLLTQTQKKLDTARQTVAEIHISPSEGYTLFINQVGGKIIFGLPPFANKVARLKSILDEFEQQLLHIEMVDLDYNRKAFVRLKHQGTQIIAQKGW